MTHRATIERDTSSTADAWGNPVAPVWAAHLTDLACRVWFDTESEVLDGNKTATVERRKMIVPIGTDVTEADRVAIVEDRLGATLFSGPAGIESVGRRRDHLVLTLEAVGS